MKTISKLALAAVLSTGVAGTALVAPAAAQKEKGKKDEAALKLTPAVQKPASAAQTAMQAKDLATAEAQLAIAEPAAVTDDDKYIVAALRYDLEASKMRAAQVANPNAPIDETVLVKPLDVLIANPRTPPASRGQYTYRRGWLAFNARQYPQAIQYYTQARTLGYNDPELDLQIAKAKLEGSDVAGGLNDLNTVIERQTAAGQKPPEAYYRYGVARANAAKMGPETLVWLKKWVSAYPTAKNWHDVAFVYGIQQNSVAKLDNQQTIDLWRLLRAAGALADQAEYREYAQKVFDRGLPAETKTVLNEGMAKGKLTGSADAQQLLTLANTGLRQEPANAVLETRAKAGANGSLAAQTGDSYLGQDMYPKAAEMYRLALQKGGVNADEVNTRLGIALAKSGDKAGAQTAFALVKGAPRADLAALWSAWLSSPTTA